jgi:hypothetical protein
VELKAWDLFGVTSVQNFSFLVKPNTSPTFARASPTGDISTFAWHPVSVNFASIVDAESDEIKFRIWRDSDVVFSTTGAGTTE